VSGRPGWIVGVAAVIVLGYITYNTLRTPSQGGVGLPAGRSLPAFAAEIATSANPRDFDANVSARACAVRGPDVLNSCALAARGPVVLAFTIVPSQRCEEQMTMLDRLRARFPRVRFAGVAIRGKRADIRAAVQRGGWKLPVGWDRDGVVANLYAVSVCPTIVLARRGGKIQRSLVGVQDEARLAREIAAL
jgi:hypothetical protein